MDIVSSEKIKYAFSRLNNFINQNYANTDFSFFINVDQIDKPELTVIAKAIQAFNLMIAALEEDNKGSLPSLIPYVDSDYRRIVILDIISDFESLVTCLIDNDLKSARIHLRYVNYYLADLNLSSANEKAILKSLIESSSQLKKELEVELINLKNKNNLINEVTLGSEKIKNELKIVKDNQDVISSIKEQIQVIFENAKKDIDFRTNEFDELSESITKNINDVENFEKSLKQFNKQIEQVDNEYKKEIKEILENKENLQKLVQLETGNLLGGRFDERKLELRKSVEFWSIAIGVLLVVSIIWTVVVFTCLSFGPMDNWLSFLVNSLKTVPVFFVLGFAINQYSKERNFQEEYAFKASISMTLKAFSEMLSQTEKDQYPAQIEMLQKSISMIYTQPRVHTESNRPFFSLHSKDFSESLKAVAEGLKNFKS